jgi:diaminohydroxyphosphoribosylaminopyrimidine deaminase/5-amino-6-(5-phosphoribosylamino)uracil reductase
VGDLGFQLMSQALQLKNVTVNYLNPDILIEGYLQSEQ